MSATPDQLPNTIEEMKQLFLAQAANIEKLNAELAVASKELAAAKAGLIAYVLEIENSNSSSPGSGAKNTAARRSASSARSRSSS